MADVLYNFCTHLQLSSSPEYQHIPNQFEFVVACGKKAITIDN